MLFTNFGNGSVPKGIRWERFAFCCFICSSSSSHFCCSIFNGLLLHNFQSTAYVVPQLWQPANGTLMTNDTGDNNPPEESAACIALSKNDSYVMSASGGKVSLFNMMTFKVCCLPASLEFISFLHQSSL